MEEQEEMLTISRRELTEIFEQAKKMVIDSRQKDLIIQELKDELLKRDFKRVDTKEFMELLR